MAQKGQKNRRPAAPRRTDNRSSSGQRRTREDAAPRRADNRSSSGQRRTREDAAPRRADNRSSSGQRRTREPAAPRRAYPADENHAPVYDQYEGGAKRQAPVQRRRKRARRLTQAEVRRRRIRRRFATAIFVFAVIAIGIVLSVVLLFKVNKFEIQNVDGSAPADTGVYTEEDIVAALGITKGENLFSFKIADKITILNSTFPLLERVEMYRRIPDTVVVRVEPAVESFCVQTGGGWAVLSRYLKVISLSADQPALPVLSAQVSTVPQQGSILALDQENGNDTLLSLLDTLEQAGMLDSVTAVNITSVDEISFVYQGRIRIKLGTLNNMDYKMQWTSYILRNENGDGCSDTDMGVLDVSHLRTDGTIRPTFAQGDPNAEEAPAEEAPAEGEAPVEGEVPAEGEAPAEGGEELPAA